MSIRKVELVCKRDGRVVPYDEERVAEAIQKASRLSGCDNATIGRDLAGVVTMYLERYREQEMPTTDDIQKLVEKVLIETGHGEIARAYIFHRARKGADRPEAEAAPAQDLFPSRLILVDGATRAEAAPWSRERISAALVKEAGLEELIAHQIAEAVEQTVFRLGEPRVHTSLIRELVNHELLARGYGSKVRRQIVVGLPKYDLVKLVADGEPRIDPEGMCRAIGQNTLRQYALQEVFSRDVADAHVEGRLHLHGLEEPLKLYALMPSVPEIRRTGVRVQGSAVLSEPASVPRSLTVQLGRVVSDARRFFSGPVTFLGLSEAYDQLLWGSDDDRVRSEIEHLAAALQDAYTEVIPSHRTALGIASLGRSTVRVAGVGEDLRGFCRAAVDRGMVFAFDRSVPLPSGWRTSAQAITINLPQAFYRSEAGSDFYTELEAVLELSVKAHLQKRQLMRRFMDRATGTFGLGLGWTRDGAGPISFEDLEYAVGVSGLNEAVRLLCGEEIPESDAAVLLALRIVSYVYFRLREEATRRGWRLLLEEVPADETTERFARIDAQLYPRARGILEDRTGYTPGFRTRGASTFEALALEARFHTVVPSARAAADRTKLGAADLFSLLHRLHDETLASHLAVE